MAVKRSGSADRGARIALNKAKAEKTAGARSGSPESDSTAKVARETTVGATVASKMLTAFSCASRRSAASSTRRAEATSSAQSDSQRCSFTACCAASVASVRRSRSSVAVAVRLRREASACAISACAGIIASITASPPSTGGPKALHSMNIAMLSWNGADHSIFKDPHKLLIRAPSEASKLHNKPLSARSDRVRATAFLHTAAPRAARARAPNRSACQKYWLTSSACSNATTGNKMAKQYASHAMDATSEEGSLARNRSPNSFESNNGGT
mmetsp:Transcript_156400/g.501742  ORF Transcript_156400/g.501742 Transcript_156400/m.501742 type:complete len:270 (+) Transcript_156400:3617-4426(+)